MTSRHQFDKVVTSLNKASIHGRTAAGAVLMGGSEVFNWLTKTKQGRITGTTIIFAALLRSHFTHKEQLKRPDVAPVVGVTFKRVLSPQAENRLEEIGKRVSQFTFPPDQPDRKKGRLTKAELQVRTKIIDPFTTVVYGYGGVDFYRFSKRDEALKNPSEIRQRLSQFSRWHYLTNSSYDQKQRGFNFSRNAIKEGAMAPIPLKVSKRTVSDRELLFHCNKAIEELILNQRYSKSVLYMLDRIGRDKLLALMVSTSKKECGPFPVGTYELYRSETVNKKVIYSFGMWQILNDGYGARTLSRLNLMPSQAYHPINGAKWFLAFLAEKSRLINGRHDIIDSILPIHSKWQNRFAIFYNGSHAKPDYPRNLGTYFKQVTNFLNGGKNSVSVGPALKNSPVFDAPLDAKVDELVNILQSTHEKTSGLRTDENVSMIAIALKGAGTGLAKNEVIAARNADAAVPVASMNKVAIAIAFYATVAKPNVHDRLMLGSMLVNSNNNATNFLIRRTAAAAGCTSSDHIAVATAVEDVLKRSYPGKFNATQLQYIPKSSRAYEMKSTMREYAHILVGLEEKRFTGSSKILALMNHPVHHNRLIRKATTLPDSITSANKTGTTTGVVGDGAIIRCRNAAGDIVSWVVVVTIDRPVTKAHQENSSYHNFMQRGDDVLGEISDLTYRTISLRFNTPPPLEE